VPGAATSPEQDGADDESQQAVDAEPAQGAASVDDEGAGGGEGLEAPTDTDGADATEQGAGGGSSDAAGEGEGGGTEDLDDAQSGDQEQARAEDGDDYVGDISVTVHDRVNTLLVVNWDQVTAAEQVWLEFSFEDDEWLTSRPSAGEMGPHEDVVIGVPGETEVRIRVVSSASGTDHVSTEQTGTTQALPAGMPTPEVLAYDPERASPERYLFGSVEDSPGGSFNGYYLSTFWLYIMDRQGRIVWYYADPSSNATTSFQRIARDGGEYIWLEKRCYGCGNFEESVVRMTLDWKLFEELEVPGLGDCMDVTDEGTVLYDAGNELRERLVDGTTRTIWSCQDHFGPGFLCYTNTINWDATTDSVFMSCPEPGTVVEVRRSDGQLMGQYGNHEGSWSFAAPLESPPDAWGFGFQHFPNLSPDGTLMLSSHMPGYEDTSNPVEYQHAFLEFEIDRENQQLIEVWRYTEGPEWPHAKGMAMRLDNGNTLANCSTGGVIREITPDKETVFQVKFDAEGGNDFYNTMVGHNVLIDDLYALNGGL
jgi:hypothetical protein